jgi:hypothetical protein
MLGNLKRLCFVHRFLPRVSVVDQFSKPDDTAPLLHPHYRGFCATTGCSAPIPRIGTLILVGLPLGFLP